MPKLKDLKSTLKLLHCSLLADGSEDEVRSAVARRKGGRRVRDYQTRGVKPIRWFKG